MNTGIALIPSVPEIELLVELQKSLLRVSPLEAILETKRHLPHITLLQGKSQAPLCSLPELEAIAGLAARQPGGSVVARRLEYKANGWYFLTLEKSPWISMLHDAVFRLCASRLVVDESVLKMPMTNYTAVERQNLIRYGYRYIGDQFLPHFTLGRTQNRERLPHEDDLFAIVDSEVSGRSFKICQLSLYKMGENGSHETQIEKVDLEV